jgi:hypothetical protein
LGEDGGGENDQQTETLTDAHSMEGYQKETCVCCEMLGE